VWVIVQSLPTKFSIQTRYQVQLGDVRYLAVAGNFQPNLYFFS